jgi:hypothetical protein
MGKRRERYFDRVTAARRFMKSWASPDRTGYPARVLQADDDCVTVLFLGTNCVVRATLEAVTIEHAGQRQELRWSEFAPDSYRRPPGGVLRAALYWNREAVVTAQFARRAGPWHAVRAPGWVIAILVGAILMGFTPKPRAPQVPPEEQS